MKRAELDSYRHVMAMKIGNGVGTEIDASDDNEALLMTGSLIIAAIKFMDEENRPDALKSLKHLLDKYDEWIEDPDLDQKWEEK